ncbi:MAG: hypothetical protein FWH43_04625 [Endomicrobia bacterium]|nr:hypothetical protein [Endomicrobiia bacterium]
MESESRKTDVNLADYLVNNKNADNNMTNTKIYAWIFLTINEQPTSLDAVLLNADGINRADPMLKELQLSLGWLRAQGLVSKEGKNYLRTKSGIALFNSISHRNIFDKWDAITEKFSQLPEVDFQPDDITEKEVGAANRRNRELVRKLMRKMDEEKNTKSAIVKDTEIE